MHSSKLDIEQQKEACRFPLKVAAVTWALAVLLFVIGELGVFLSRLLGLIAIWHSVVVLFHGVSFVSLKLDKKKSIMFQTSFSLVFPLVLSLWFLRKGPSDWSEFAFPQSWWVLLPIAIIAYASFLAGRQTDADVPARGLFVAVCILFAFTFLGDLGIYVGDDDYDPESSSLFIDTDIANTVGHSATKFGQFVGYTTVAYAGILIGRHKRTDNATT